MWLPLNSLPVQQLRPEYGPDALGAFAALADKPDSSTGKALKRRHPDLLLEAAGHDLAFVELQKEGPAHDLAFRLAAARASRALV